MSSPKRAAVVRRAVKAAQSLSGEAKAIFDRAVPRKRKPKPARPSPHLLSLLSRDELQVIGEKVRAVLELLERELDHRQNIARLQAETAQTQAQTFARLVRMLDAEKEAEREAPF